MYPCFRGGFLFFLNSPSHNILCKPLAVFQHEMDGGERGMNPIALTIINHQIEYWPSQGSIQRPPVPKACTRLNELWGSALL